MTDTPNPGSDEAMDRGCLCPRYDNAKGRGAWGTEGEDAVFWVAPSCPLHGTTRKTIERRMDEIRERVGE